MVFAFSRDGAVPGHNLWRRLEQAPDADLGGAVRRRLRVRDHDPGATSPTSAGTPVAFLAVTSISVIGLYIAYTIPVFLRWRPATRFQPGPWTLGNKYKWMNLIAIVWVALCMIIFCLPFSPEACSRQRRVQLERVQLRAARGRLRDPGGHDLVLRLGQQDVQGPDPDD